MAKTWNLDAEAILKMVSTLDIEYRPPAGAHEGLVELAKGFDKVSPHMLTDHHWIALAAMALDQAGCSTEQVRAAIEVAMGERRVR